MPLCGNFENAKRLHHLPPKDSIILRVRPNPNPVANTVLQDRQSTVILSDPHRPKRADRLELKRRMLRIALPKKVLLPGSLLNRLGKLRKSLPKFRRYQ
jgi:hypothetical protein